MKTTRKFALTTSLRCNDLGVYEPRLSEWERSKDCLSKQIQEVEKLRRAAYRRLAKTVGISWLGCRREAGRK